MKTVGTYPALTWRDLDEARRREVLSRPVEAQNQNRAEKVSGILDRVRTGGDQALLRMTREFDRVSLSSLEVSQSEFLVAERLVSMEAREALATAAENIEKFHRRQLKPNSRVETMPGVWCERQSRPISRIGLYIPGGTAPLISTALMLGIPARLAEVPVRIVCTPPRADGSIDPNLLVAVKMCGIERVFKVGGAQAIAAMAYGTETVPAVDKVFGPGNAWVTEAKRQVAVLTTVAIDMPAGPSEVLVIADASADPEFVAADLLSQAEHGPDSQAVLLTNDALQLEAVVAAVDRQLAKLPRSGIAAQALAQSRWILVDSIAEAIEVSNRYAPEHLILQVESPASWSEKITSAGSVFLGAWSPEAAGDYASGTNHVLPTYGYAHTWSGLSVDSFLKQITFQQLSFEGLQRLGPAIETLATLEGLEGHRNAVRVRLKRGMR